MRCVLWRHSLQIDYMIGMLGDQICNQFESKVPLRTAMPTNGMAWVWCNIWQTMWTSSSQSGVWFIMNAASLLLWRSFVQTCVVSFSLWWLAATSSWWVCFFFCLVLFGFTSIALRSLHASWSAHEKDFMHVCCAHWGVGHVQMYGKRQQEIYFRLFHFQILNVSGWLHLK